MPAATTTTAISTTPGQRILARLISAFLTEQGSFNEIVLTAVGNRIQQAVYEPIYAMARDVLPQLAEGNPLDVVAAGYGLERREKERDEWLRERIGREVFGEKATRPALEDALAGLFTPEAEIVEWIRDQWFVGKSYLGVNTWSCDRAEVAFRVLVRVNNTRKTIEQRAVFVGRSFVGMQYLFEDKLEYSVPMDFLWHLIRAVKPAGVEANVEILN